MIVAVRRGLAGLALGLVVSFGAAGAVQAASPTPTPTATATASASPSGDVDAGETTDTPDVAPDNTRTYLAVAAAAGLALVAASIVFLRRR